MSHQRTWERRRARARTSRARASGLGLWPIVSCVLVLAAGGDTPAQGATRSPPFRVLSRTLEARLSPDLLDPAPPGSVAELRLVASSGERWFTLFEPGLFAPSLSLGADVQGDGGGRLLVVVASDPDRTRGLLVDLGGAAGDTVTVHRLRPTGSERIAEAPMGRPAPGTWTNVRVELRSRELRVSVAGIPVFGERGVASGAVEPGRLQLGAAGGPVRLRGSEVIGQLTAASRRRLARRASVRLPEPLATEELPLRWPLELVAGGDLVTGLPEADAQRLLDLARGAESAPPSRISSILDEADGLVRRHPEVPGPALVAGAARLAHHVGIGRARQLLERAADLPGAAALLGDACWLLGDHEAARVAYGRARPPHHGGSGLALVHRALGRRAEAVEALAGSERSACRRCRLRARLVRDLEALECWDELAVRERDGIRVLSDLDAAEAERHLRWASELLPVLRQELGLSRGSQLVTIIACSVPEAFQAWNERLGFGARWSEADGVYRAGTGLLILRDDPDAAVARRRLQHELVHHVVHEGALELPAAFEEGLAECLAGWSPGGSLWSVAQVPAPGRFPQALELMRRAQGGGSIRFLEGHEPRSGDEGRRDYALAWAALSLLASDASDEDPGTAGGAAAACLKLFAGDAADAAWALIRDHVTPARLRAHLEDLAGRRP